MKCQQCDKQAVFHITELETGEVRELHLCEDHARTYLSQSESAGGNDEGGPGTGLSGPLTVGQTADELAVLDKKACDMCGITFSNSVTKAGWDARRTTPISRRNSSR